MKHLLIFLKYWCTSFTYAHSSVSSGDGISLAIDMCVYVHGYHNDLCVSGSLVTCDLALRLKH